MPGFKKIRITGIKKTAENGGFWAHFGGDHDQPVKITSFAATSCAEGARFSTMEIGVEIA
jgi:hypothetical protein